MSLLLFPALSLLLLGAHALRTQGVGPALFWLGLVALTFCRRAWARLVLIAALGLGLAVQTQTAWSLVSFRLTAGEPWVRLGLIMVAVLALTSGSALLLTSARAARRFDQGAGKAWPQALALVLTVATLLLARSKVSFPILLADRLPVSWGGWTQLGWPEALGLGLYAAWLAGKFLEPGAAPRLRPRIWALFSALFFGQLLLGLAGIEELLMTGKLHLPIPALIAAGPVFRGGGYFMLILFGVTLLLVGPAWCSHLCYIGAWDDLMSRRGGRSKANPKTEEKNINTGNSDSGEGAAGPSVALKAKGLDHGPRRARVPAPLPRWAVWGRPVLLVLVLAAALGLRLAGTAPVTAALWAAAFGLAGVGVMVVFSRHLGMMAHCTAFCPIGILSNVLGRISPWRLAISSECTGCRACSRACRYNALTPIDLERNRPGLSCTLCGDCLPACPHAHLGYRFPGLTPDQARTVFLVLVTVLHAVFLGVARI